MLPHMRSPHIAAGLLIVSRHGGDSGFAVTAGGVRVPPRMTAPLHRASGSWRAVALRRSCCSRSLLTGSAMSPDGLVTGELVPVLSSDLDGGDTSFDVISARERAAVHEVLVVTLCERALLAMTHGRWSQAETLAGEARTVFSQA